MFERLLALHQSTLPKADATLVRRAFEFAEIVHAGQTRKDGSSFISHPLAVAQHLTEIKANSEMIAAALLHAVFSVGKTGRNELQRDFGPMIFFLVDKLTELSELSLPIDDSVYRKNAHQLLLSLATDGRVLLVRLADRLHNLETSGTLPALEQRWMARKALDLYLPLARLLGIRLWASSCAPGSGLKFQLVLRLFTPSTANSYVSRRREKRGGLRWRKSTTS